MVETIDSTWLELLDEEWIEALDSTPFLSRCRSGEVTRAELEVFAIQHFHYSRHFTRYLCALLGNMGNDADRLALIDNLVDEMGLGKSTGTPHSQIYRQMIERLGWSPVQSEMFAETKALVTTMMESCRNPNPVIGLGALCLGAEAIVPHLYRQIVAGFLANGVSKEELNFFLLHIECDDEHALTMKKIIEREITTPFQKQMLRCSAARVIAARARMFGAISVRKEVVHVHHAV